MENFVTVYLLEYDQGEPGIVEAKLQHRLGIELLKRGLKNEWGIEFSSNMIVKGEHGKPGIDMKGIFFNISHCRGMVACALSNVPVGADVERARTVREGVIKRAFSKREQEYILNHYFTDAFLRLWTLKESYIKMTGEGLRHPLREVDFELSSGQEAEVKAFWDPDEIRCSQEGFFYQMRLEKDCFLAVCAGERVCEPLIIRDKFQAGNAPI